MTAHYTADHVDNDVKFLAELTAQRGSIDDTISEIKARLRTLGIGRHETSHGSLVISPNRRFDPKTAEKVLADLGGPALIQACTKSVIDSATTKRAVSPSVYEQCSIEVGEPRVSTP